MLCDIAAFLRRHRPRRDATSSRTSNSAREIAAGRFNFHYGATLVEPQATLSEFPEIPGIDGRKMSKSYGNAIDLSDDEPTTVKKVRSMITDPLKIRRNDPGRPEICPVFKLHHLSNTARVPQIERDCRSGALGCVDCKMELAESINRELRPLRERRAQIDTATVREIVESGSERARTIAESTLKDVRAGLKLTSIPGRCDASIISIAQHVANPPNTQP